MKTAPTDTDQQVQWLVDRAQIEDLLAAYARRADTKDWEGFAGLFAAEGKIVLPFGDIPKDTMAESVERILKPFELTHHMFTNIVIDIDGDAATSRHYLHATHVPKTDEPGRHADVGGWYDNTYRRTEDGWRIVSVELAFIWLDGVPFEPGDPAE